MFENVGTMEQVLFDFLDELIERNEALEDLNFKDDWTVDDFLIATIQFIDFLFEAKMTYMCNHF